jgi:hypothetical protein
MNPHPDFPAIFRRLSERLDSLARPFSEEVYRFIDPRFSTVDDQFSGKGSLFADIEENFDTAYVRLLTLILRKEKEAPISVNQRTLAVSGYAGPNHHEKRRRLNSTDQIVASPLE